VKKKAVLYSLLLSAFAVSLILALTSAGFPYSGSIEEPRVQRHMLTHTKRTFYDSNGDVRFRDGGFFIFENERNTKRTLDTFISSDDLQYQIDEAMCATEAFCGYPSYNSSRGFWVEAVTQPAIEPTTFTTVSINRNESFLELNFELIGKTLTLLYVATESNVQLVSSSIGFSQKEWMQDRFARYLKIVHGKQSNEPFPFQLLLQAPTTSVDLVKITVVTIDSSFENVPMNSEFSAFVDRFPSYTFVQPHHADVSSFVF